MITASFPCTHAICKIVFSLSDRSTQKIFSGTLTELQNMNNGRGYTWIEKSITENNLFIASYKYRAKINIYINCYLIID